MATFPAGLVADVRRALSEVEAQMSRAFAEVGDTPAAGSALDQSGLRDGGPVVEDYLRHGEPGLALEHLIYMVREPSLPISAATFALIERAGRAMGLGPELWEDIRPGGAT